MRLYNRKLDYKPNARAAECHGGTQTGTVVLFNVPAFASAMCFVATLSDKLASITSSKKI